MRVAIYNHTSAVSGAEISLLLTARHMKAAEPIIFAPEGELLSRAREANLQVVPIPGYRARLSRNPLRTAADMAGMLWAGFQFARAVRRYRIDVVHANSMRAGIMSSLFEWMHGRPLIWHVRDTPPGGRIGRGISRLASLTARSVIGNSGYVLSRFDWRRSESGKHMVHNGVEVREISEPEKQRFRTSLREELRTPSTAKVLTIIGQIAPWKRQADALHATKELLKRGHDVVLWVVGEAKFREENSTYFDALRKLASQLEMDEQVRFTGFRQDIAEICCAADLLCLCSDNEPFGRVMIEAMAQSVPVVATNAGGVPEVVENEQTGLLYEVGRIEELARCAERLITNDKVRREMGLRAAARVREHFTIQSSVRQIEDIYRTVMAN